MGSDQKCFVCKNKIQNDKLTNRIKQQQECTRFYSLVCRYLNIVDNGIDMSRSNPQITLLPSESILKGNEIISCCDICIPLIKSFCDTYNNWKILQLVLNWKLETITKLMLMKSKFDQSDESGHGHVPGFEIFRKTFLTVATDKSRDFPRLNIPKVKVTPSFQNDPVNAEESKESFCADSPEISNFENDNFEEFNSSELHNNQQQKSGIDFDSVATAQPKQKRKITPKSKKDTQEESLIYVCRFCKKEFKRRQNCVSHEKIHSGIKPYKCRYNCGKQFLENRKRKKHEISVHNRNLAKYQCNFCDKKYVEKCNLIDHERSHTGEKPWSCCVCNQQFSIKGNWRKHERKHTLRQMRYEANKRDQSNWKYKCRFCSKKFDKESVQIMHERIHTGQRPYKCSYCDKRFCQPYSKKRHELNHKQNKTKRVSSNKELLKTVKLEVEVDQQYNDAAAGLEDDLGNANNSEAFLVRIVKSENDTLES